MDNNLYQVQFISSFEGNTSDNNFSNLNFGPTVGDFLEGRSSMGKETLAMYKLILFIFMLRKDDEFFFWIGFLKIRH